jgi:hypothetical protein
MPDTFQAVAVLVIALLPGALYVWAFERQAGRWGVGLSDRLLRFVGGSALFHAAAAPLAYWLWADRWDEIRTGEPVSWWMWPLVVAYVAIPAIGGTVVGRGVRSEKSWTTLFTGPDPAPRAWDHLFGQKADGWVRLRLKSGVWIGGAYADANGRRSYAAGYPEPQDLFLAAAVELDPETGEFVVDDDGNVALLDGGILVRWEEVEHLEFIDA